MLIIATVAVILVLAVAISIGAWAGSRGSTPVRQP